MNIRSCCLFVWVLLLVGCASAPTQPPAQPPLPDTPPKPPDKGIVIAPAPKPAMSGNPAVIAMLDKARSDAKAGQREAAGASLERGLRIEPRNGWLWQELAQLRLVQGLYAQAIALAKKSISFAGRERRLLAINWRVIGNARIAQGNLPEAEQAFKFAAEYEQ